MPSPTQGEDKLHPYAPTSAGEGGAAGRLVESASLSHQQKRVRECRSGASQTTRPTKPAAAVALVAAETAQESHPNAAP